MTAKSENISIRLKPDIRAQVDRLAKANQRSRNFIINEAVGRYVAETALASPPPATQKKNMGVGAWKGQMAIHPSFYDDMTSEELSLWEDGPIEPPR
jgi:prolipoprotein diacylglyceryltransferase